MNTLLASFFASLIGTLLVLRYRHLHIGFTGDHPFDGREKFHLAPVPRVGSIGIVLGLSAAILVGYHLDSSSVGVAKPMLIAAIPVLLSGFFEDITKQVSAKTRVFGGLVSTLLAGYLLNAWVGALQVAGLDDLIGNIFWLSVAFTCFAVVGLINAFNIIDGYNGLSGMVGVIILSAIFYVALKVSDTQIMIAALAMIGAILGFLVFNYPRGLIFLGDGGAYLIGFWIAILSILLTNRHSEISKWFPVVLVIYPVTETLFSVVRRSFLHRTGPLNPDAAHLHNLIYLKMEKWLEFPEDDRSVARNSATSLYLWGLTTVSVVPALVFWNNVWALRMTAIVFILAYVYLYRNLSAEADRT